MIGILAGMGPKSTGPFINEVVSSFQKLTGAKNDIDYPPMMIYSLPTPFYPDKPIDHTLMSETICKGLKKLEACGVSFIAMACNTAHIYFNKLEHCIQIPLLNIVQATLERLPNEAQKLTILATRPTMESKLYQQKIAQTGIEYIFQNDWQDKIDALLRKIKDSSNRKEPLRLWKDFSAILLQEGVDTIISACTDLNVLFEEGHSEFTILDSSACLAEAVVQTWISLLKP